MKTFEEHSRNIRGTFENIREHKSTSHLEYHQNWDITTNGHQIRICQKKYISHSVTIMCFRSVLTELWIFRRSSRMFQKLHNSKTQNSETLTQSKNPGRAFIQTFIFFCHNSNFLWLSKDKISHFGSLQTVHFNNDPSLYFYLLTLLPSLHLTSTSSLYFLSSCFPLLKLIPFYSFCELMVLEWFLCKFSKAELILSVLCFIVSLQVVLYRSSYKIDDSSLVKQRITQSIWVRWV